MEKNNEAPFLGAILDTRSEAEKEKDFLFDEIVAAAAPVNWVEKDEVRRFPIFNQDGSGSCVAQTVAKLAGIMYAKKNAGEYIHFSASHIYQRRANKPSAGMIGTNAFDIARQSITLEALAPSQSMTDAQMDGLQIADYKNRVGEIFKFGNYVILPNRDIDTIASTIQETGKGVMVWFYFKTTEWKRDMPLIKYPDLANGSEAARHSVTAVDFTLIDGKKYLVIEDSWGPDTGVEGQRLISEDFFKKRNFFCAYPINFNFEEGNTNEVGGNFQKDLEFSATVNHDNDVVDLQNILKREGFFPNNVASSGYYGAITARGVLAWQLKYIPEYGEEKLRELEGKIVGPSTRAKLNQMYNK